MALNKCWWRLCSCVPTNPDSVFCERCEQDRRPAARDAEQDIPADIRYFSTSTKKGNEMSNSAPLQITNLTAVLSDAIGTLPVVCTLSFTDPNSPSAGVTIERTRSSDPSCDTWVLLATLAAGLTTFTDDTLTFGGVYRYRVQALPVQSIIFTPAKYAEISVQTAGLPPHTFDHYPQGIGQGNGLTYQGAMKLSEDGTL